VSTIRVAIVDDSPLMRRLIAGALSGAADIEVAGTACDAFEARELIRAADPDVVTLDVNMPGMNGLEFLRKIIELRPMPVVMVSALTAEGAETSVAALQLGAIDVVQKPRGPGSLDGFAAALQAKVRLAAAARPRLARTPARPAAPAVSGAFTRALVAIGASTGGVNALTTLLGALPASLPPIVVVQHMPKGFPERFAARLRADLGRDIAEARHGEVLRHGAVRFALGDRHLRVVRRGDGFACELAEGPPVAGHCPSVDVLFESVARAAGRAGVGVVLTGMGRDGAIGLAAMRRAGAACLAQGPETSVVWGMPRAAREAGAVEEEAELPALPRRICHFLTSSPILPGGAGR
jgi:two-component system chemotaxis response regulator CheB